MALALADDPTITHRGADPPASKDFMSLIATKLIPELKDGSFAAMLASTSTGCEIEIERHTSAKTCDPVHDYTDCRG